MNEYTKENMLHLVGSDLIPVIRECKDMMITPNVAKGGLGN